MNIEVICDNSMCDRCKTEQSTEVYETYSTINGGTILLRAVCDECYAELCIEDRE